MGILYGFDISGTREESFWKTFLEMSRDLDGFPGTWSLVIEDPKGWAPGVTIAPYSIGGVRATYWVSILKGHLRCG